MKLFFCITLAFLYAANLVGQNAVQKTLNSYKDSINNTYGLIALIDNGTGAIETGTIGIAFKNQPVSIKNKFCIGSCTKMYTATLILKLYEQGLLKLTDSLYRYIPFHKFIDSTITINQLLNHTSGLMDYTSNGFINKPLFEPFADYSDTYILSLIDTVNFKKGTRYQYSNTNYFLLRKIIEQVADKPYELVLQEYIFDPLGLKNTFPYYSNQTKGMAHPLIDGQDLQDVSKIGSNNISKGVGNIVSDLYDVNKFIRALLIDKTLLQEETLNLMSNFYEYKNNKVGLGLFEEKFGGHIVWGHTGRQVSYISYAFVDPTTKRSIIILTNNANDTFIDSINEMLWDLK